jgi:hypothetical protein
VPPRLATLLVLVFAVSVLAGCGGSSSDETAETRTGTATGEVTVPGPAEAPAGATAKSCETFATDAEALRATGIPCDQARQVMYGWQREGSCALPSGASRGGCLTRSYRCQAVRTDRGTAVSCSRAGESVAFVAKRG